MYSEWVEVRVNALQEIAKLGGKFTFTMLRKFTVSIVCVYGGVGSVRGEGWLYACG